MRNRAGAGFSGGIRACLVRWEVEDGGEGEAGERDCAERWSDSHLRVMTTQTQSPTEQPS